jgi:arsenite methyltransferase
MQQAGFLDFRVIESSPISVSNPRIEAKIGNIKFSSKTIRAFKLDSLEDRCEGNSDDSSVS